MNETTILNFIILTPSKFLTLFVLGNPKLLSFSFYFQSPEHLLTFLLISISFMGHVSIGCAIYQEEQEAPTKRTLFDKLYYHVVTFTTVGFGDVMPYTEREINQAISMFFYRVFGFALLYGALKALYCWYKTQQEALAVLKLIQQPLKARGRISNILPCCCCRPRLRDEPKVDATMLI